MNSVEAKQQYANTCEPLRVFKQANLQQYFYEEKFLTFADLLILSSINPIVRENFLHHFNWQTIILKNLIRNRAYKICRALEKPLDYYSMLYEIGLKRATQTDNESLDAVWRIITYLEDRVEGDRLKNEVALFYVEKKDLTGIQVAFKLIETINDPEIRTNTIRGVGLLRANKKDKEAVEEALKLTSTILDLEEKDNFLRDISVLQAQKPTTDAIDKAYEIASRIQTEETREQAHQGICLEIAYKGDILRAFHLATTLPQAAWLIAVERAKQKDSSAIRNAITLARQITDPIYQRSALRGIYLQQAQKEIPEAINLAFELAKTDTDESIRDSFYSDLAVIQAGKDDPEAVQKSLKLVEKIKDSIQRGRALKHITIVQATKDALIGLDESFKIANMIEDSNFKASALKFLALVQAHDDITLALQTTQKIEIIYEQSQTQMEIARRVIEQKSLPAIDKALEIAKGITRLDIRDDTLALIAVTRAQLSDSDCISDALSIAAMTKFADGDILSLLDIAQIIKPSLLPPIDVEKGVVKCLYKFANSKN